MGPLKGIKVIEFAGIGPGPFCAMMLADMGAEVIRIDRKGEKRFGRLDITSRGRRSIALDLKNQEGVKTALRLIEKADALLEGFRPSVMERLGLGPEQCFQVNPRLVYGRMTGWGQNGPLSHAAGHDINYIALTSALYSIGRPDSPPVPPLNLVGDFGGGAMMLAFGLVCGVLEAKTSGQGQVVDAAMTDGASALMTYMYGFKAAGKWNNSRGTNRLDGGAHFYDSYECSDGKYISIAAYETQFYALFLKTCGIDDPAFHAQLDVEKWPELKQKLTQMFKTKTREEWCALMEGTDICFAPVLDMDEAPEHPHNKVRKTFIEIDGVVQPAPAPKFSRTHPEIQGCPPFPGEHNEEVLSEWGFSEAEIENLHEGGAI
ncbi:alpha-methylacyl-CoA racemase [Geothermobacter ehrlichii]|uniref:Alpha-methylacyl-CoA racemase n=1 Tax=Geothermobacter ehrlichii TaxID=213224 RepID=A0A5D3WJF8_9BACT|nr:CaiB/BaiF CoA-transferase family protein [Geothermobacter ehrlichii]TYO98431.1 alpha-methylacyl-CoA racemase [Geothermobacter ehrlichii]